MFAASLVAGIAMLGAEVQSVQQPTHVDDVVVSARQLERQVESFVADMTVPDNNLNVARWHRDMCVSVVNMRNDAAQYIIDRVAEISNEVGVKPGAPGCDANVTVIATSHANQTASELVQRYPSIMMSEISGSRRSRGALQRFTESELPIRWWHTSMPIVAETGAPAVKSMANHMMGEYRDAGDIIPFDFPFVEVNSTHLRSGLRSDIVNAIIILDMTKLGGVNVPQIADYIAMVTLTRPGLEANFSAYDSILAMTADHTVPGLSEWDMTYLKTLYRADLTQKQKQHQMYELRYHMVDSQIRRPLIKEEQASAAETP